MSQVRNQEREMSGDLYAEHDLSPEVGGQETEGLGNGIRGGLRKLT